MASTVPVEKIILFDGVCNLCSASVRFVIRRDKRKRFRFASLQSEFGRRILEARSVDDDMKTIVLVKGDDTYFRSDAALEVCKELGGLWPSLYFFKIVPRFIRDAIYEFISQHRYKWFGKTEECWLPSPDLSTRFVD